MRRTAKYLIIAATVSIAGCAESARETQPIAVPARDDALAASRPAPADVLAAAEAGDARAAFLAYRQSTDPAERRKWICIAANRDLSRAQTEIAHLHWWSPGDPPSPFARDGFKYCVWSLIAAHRSEPLDETEERLRTFFPDIEQWRVRNLALAWTPDDAKCDSMAESEYYSIPGGPQPRATHANVLAAAKSGDARAAYLAYRQATTDAERRKWICLAANREYPQAQAEVARLHSRSRNDPPGPFEPDLYKAYIWSIIAIYKRVPLEEAEQRLGWMVTEGKWRAISLAISWKPDPAQCENLKDSEYFNVP